MMLQRYLLPAVLAPAMLFSTLALAVPLGVRDDGSDVDGKFRGADEVDGFLRFGDAADERVVLNYAYAIAEPRIDGAARAGEKPVPFTIDQTRIIVFLTDYPIPQEARGNIAKIHALANAREFVGLELSFDSARRKPTWTGRLLLGLDSANQVFRPRSGQRNFQLEDFSHRGNEISGQILVDRSLPLFDQYGQRTSEKFTFSVEFDLLVDLSPLPTNTLERRDAQNTPQAEILVSAIEALKRRDGDKFREMTAENSEIRNLLESPDSSDYAVSLLNYLPPTPDKLRSSISKIVFFGDRANLVMQNPAGGFREFIFERQDGKWKLSQG
ncbi:MAG TPA: hypothetical protein VMT98_05445 [Verrucomicrobiae bacterium]|nr:hypothetical protein [Verrucomicrobiae bacterium]